MKTVRFSVGDMVGCSIRPNQKMEVRSYSYFIDGHTEYLVSFDREPDPDEQGYNMLGSYKSYMWVMEERLTSWNQYVFEQALKEVLNEKEEPESSSSKQ